MTLSCKNNNNNK